MRPRARCVFWIALAWLGLAISAQAQDGEKKAEERWFLFYSTLKETQVPKGLLHLRRERRSGERPVGITQVLELWRGGARTGGFTNLLECLDDERLSPRAIQCRADKVSPRVDRSHRVSFSGGKMKREAGDGRSEEREMPARLSTTLNVLWIVEGRPFDAQQPLALDLLEAEDLRVQPDCKLEYAGEERWAEFRGAPRALHKFVLAGARGKWQFWVDGKARRLERFVQGVTEFRLTTEREARTAVAKPG